MKRPRKRLRKAIAATSTSLLVLTVVAWVWSEIHPPQELDLAIGLPSPKTWRHSLLIRNGELIYYNEDHLVSLWDIEDRREPVWIDLKWPPTPWRIRGPRVLPWGETGSWFSTGTLGTADTFEIWLPLWIPTLTFGLISWIGWRRLMTGRVGLCSTCTYDLRGLPKDAAVCPECGTGIREDADGIGRVSSTDERST